MRQGVRLRFTVVCSQRNEGPYLVEWVAWQRMLGFTDIVVVSNDCTDRSPALLDALAAAGWVRHIRCDVPDGRRITARKLAAAHADPVVRASDWVMVCDVDEFLVVHQGEGRINDLVTGDAPYLGMSINWKVFGTSGRVNWEDGLTHRQFTWSAPEGHASSVWVKSVAGHPAWFGRLGEHGPRDLRLPAGDVWGQGALRWVNADGVELAGWTPGGDYMRRVPLGLVSHRVAQINHYMVRTPEAFSLKRGTLSPVGHKDRYTPGYFRSHNRNEVEDVSTQRYAVRFDALHAEAMALPGVRPLHHLSCADYALRLAEKAGRDPSSDARRLYHLAQAGA